MRKLSHAAAAALATVACLGCSDGPHGDADGGGARADGGGFADGATAGTCGPDVACPATMPSIGGECVGSLTCDFVEPSSDAWHYTCAGGEWTAENTFCSHDGICTPPLIESCSGAPDEGPFAGATVEVGPPAGAFRPFAVGDPVPIVVGPQGGEMIRVRIRLGLADPPTCVALESTVSLDGVSGATITQPLPLHCGVSQPIFLILPLECAAFAEYDGTLHVSIAGAGDADASVRISGGTGLCPD